MKTIFINLKGIKKILLTASLFGLSTAILATAILKPASVLSAKPKPLAIYKVETNNKVAALTFNINWGNKVPDGVLDVLKKNGVKATFFISGSWAKKYPELARRIHDDGHETGSNGDRQINLSAENRSVIKEELNRSRNSIMEASGVSPALLRTPYGDWNETVLTEAAGLGFTVIQHSLDALDIQTPGRNVITNNVVKNIHPGAIILMHASDTASQTPEALTGIIEGLRAEGYELVTVSSLLKIWPGVLN